MAAWPRWVVCAACPRLALLGRGVDACPPLVRVQRSTALVSTRPLPFPDWLAPPADLGNPYSRGWAANCLEVFCTPVPPRWGQLGMQQRAEAVAEAEAEAARAQQEAAAVAPPGAGEVQMVQVPPFKHDGAAAGAAGVAAGSNGEVELLPYDGDEVRVSRLDGAGGALPLSGCWRSCGERPASAPLPFLLCA